MVRDGTTTVESSTLEEFQRLPEEDAFRLELVRGRLVREPRPGGRHSWLAFELAFRIETFARGRGLGRILMDTGFVLADDPPTVRGPDIAFLAAESVPADGAPIGLWRTAPDLAVEVLSPSNTAGEIQEKVIEYLSAGTRLVWVIDPASESVTAYRSRNDVQLLTSEDALEGGDILPGFRLAVAELFSA